MFSLILPPFPCLMMFSLFSDSHRLFFSFYTSGRPVADLLQRLGIAIEFVSSLVREEMRLVARMQRISRANHLTVTHVRCRERSDRSRRTCPSCKCRSVLFGLENANLFHKIRNNTAPIRLSRFLISFGCRRSECVSTLFHLLCKDL